MFGPSDLAHFPQPWKLMQSARDQPRLPQAGARLIWALVALALPGCDTPLATSYEVFEILEIEGQRIGHSVTRSGTKMVDGEALREISSTTEMAIPRFGVLVAQKIELTSLETASGQLLKFETKVFEGDRVALRTEGDVKGKQLVVTTTTRGNTSTARLAWDEANGGFFADRQSLKREPMKVGERRQIRALVPVATQVGEISLEAVEHEMVDLPDGGRELLRIRSVLQLAGTSIRTAHWVDESGTIYKSTTNMSGLEQTTYRVTEDELDRVVAPADFDLGTSSLVQIQRELPNPHERQQITYRARLASGDPATIFPSLGWQQVTRLDEKSAEVMVRALRPGSQLVAPVNRPPQSGDLAPNSMIQSDDPLIVEAAEEVAGAADDPWEIATSLEIYVHKTLNSQAFSQAFASAADVIRSKQGDCTEHAVLLAALCRAKQIPARVVMGLVYSRAAGGFAYHMWNEVWIDDRWIPLDATLGRGGTGPAHLTVVTSDLAGVTPYGALLPVLDVLGNLELELIRVE